MFPGKSGPRILKDLHGKMTLQGMNASDIMIHCLHGQFTGTRKNEK
jgi:hypothetical protein